MRSVRPVLSTVIIIAALVGPASQAYAKDKELLSEELLLSIYDGERTSAGRAAKLLQTAISLKSDKQTQIALLKKCVEYGFKSLTTSKSRRTTETALNRLAGLIALDDDDSFLTDKRIEFYRVCYRQYSRDRHTKHDNRSRLIGALSEGAQFAEQKKDWSAAMKAYGEIVRLAARPARPDLPSLKRKLKRSMHMKKVQQQIDLAEKKLKADPNDAASRNLLIKLFLVEYNNPVQAATYLNDDVDEILRTYIPLANLKPFEVKVSVCKEMAKWYGKVLAKDASLYAKPHVLRRGILYCDRFLNSPKRDPKEALLLGVIKRNLQKELDELKPDPLPLPKPESLAGSVLTLDLGKGIAMKLRGIPPRKVIPEDRVKGKMVGALPFYIGVTEVTQEQYQAIMDANPSTFKGPKNPVDQVSWLEAAEFCKKLAAKTGRLVRLPTEYEWVHASHSGTRTAFFFGDDDERLGDYAWFKGNTRELGPDQDRYRPVAKKKPNYWGLYDMHGNVWEWVLDRHEPKVDPSKKLPKDIRKACGGDWTTACNPGIFAWSGSAGKHKGWGFRIVIQYE